MARIEEVVPVMVGVGAAFDFLAGAKRQAPSLSKSGLEWLFRLATEPRRLTEAVPPAESAIRMVVRCTADPSTYHRLRAYPTKGDPMNLRACVAGAGGFIGHHMVEYLKANGYWVRGVDLKAPEFEPTSSRRVRDPRPAPVGECQAATARC